MLVVDKHITIPLREFQFTFSRSAGPGGQNVNKVNTKVTLRWQVAASDSLPVDVKHRLLAKFARRITKEGEILVVSQRFRDQGRNVADCLNKLREMLLSVADRPKTRRKTRPSRASRQRRLNDKRKTSEKKQLRRRPRDDS